MRIITKHSTIVFFILIILSSFSKYSVAASTNFNEDIRWSLSSLPSQIDNTDWRSLDRWYLITHLFETLVTFDLNQNVTSGVAASWFVSADRLVYTFQIRKDAMFSDGSSISASDAVYSIKRYLLTQNEDSLFKKAVAGAEKVKNVDDVLAGLESTSANEFVIRLNFPLENIWSFLAQPQIGGIVSQKSISSQDLKMNALFLASGPYRLKTISPDKIVLEANPFFHSYNREMPKTIGFYKHANVAESIEWFKQNKTNFYSQLDPFQTTGLDHLKKCEYISYPNHRVGFVYLNAKSPKLVDVNFRNRVASALSAEGFSTVHNELLSWDNNFFPRDTSGYIKENRSFEKQSLLPVSAEKTLTLLVESGLENGSFLDIVKSKLKDAGVTVVFSYLPKRDISARFSKGEFDASIISLGLPMSDNSFGAYVYFVEQPAYLQDVTGKIYQTFLEIIKTTNVIQKKSLLEAVSYYIKNDYVVLPLYHTAARYYLGKDIHVKSTNSFKTDIQLSNLRVTQSL